MIHYINKPVHFKLTQRRALYMYNVIDCTVHFLYAVQPQALSLVSVARLEVPNLQCSAMGKLYFIVK